MRMLPAQAALHFMAWSGVILLDPGDNYAYTGEVRVTEGPNCPTTHEGIEPARICLLGW